MPSIKFATDNGSYEEVKIDEKFFYMQYCKKTADERKTFFTDYPSIDKIKCIEFFFDTFIKNHSKENSIAFALRSLQEICTPEESGPFSKLYPTDYTWNLFIKDLGLVPKQIDSLNKIESEYETLNADKTDRKKTPLHYLYFRVYFEVLGKSKGKFKNYDLQLYQIFKFVDKNFRTKKGTLTKGIQNLFKNPMIVSNTELIGNIKYEINSSNDKAFNEACLLQHSIEKTTHLFFSKTKKQKAEKENASPCEDRRNPRVC